MEPLELRTHTRLWQVEKKLYKLYDYTLPMPISLRMAVIFVFAFGFWGGLCLLLGVPSAPPFGHLFWLAPPALLTWFGNRPVAEGKRLGELLFSQVGFLAQHSHYAGLTAHTAPDLVHARAEVWTPTAQPTERG